METGLRRPVLGLGRSLSAANFAAFAVDAESCRRRAGLSAYRLGRFYPVAAPLELEQGSEHHASSFDISDILFAVFKHKGKIIIGTIIGIIAAMVVRVNWPVVYESEAKLLVRYVLDRSPVDPIDNSASGSQ